MPEGPDSTNNSNIIFERRRFVRIAANFMVSYSDITTAEAKNDLTQTKNISMGGILFTTDRKFQPDTILKVKIRLPDSSDYLHAKVKVIDSRQRIRGVLYDTSVQFIGIKDEDKDAIKRVVEYNTQNKSKS
ncbi:MAG: PilZ domain-containing protein [Candidatus Omnitrophica bacterium]|nr:PilZ domain-containing protein [Candidatus Omnitrophota bacterium]MBU4149545.1 PilZ domain-containing protein [Candidatus Omnitrophota bacterium]